MNWERLFLDLKADLGFVSSCFLVPIQNHISFKNSFSQDHQRIIRLKQYYSSINRRSGIFYEYSFNKNNYLNVDFKSYFLRSNSAIRGCNFLEYLSRTISAKSLEFLNDFSTHHQSYKHGKPINILLKSIGCSKPIFIGHRRCNHGILRNIFSKTMGFVQLDFQQKSELSIWFFFLGIFRSIIENVTVQFRGILFQTMVVMAFGIPNHIFQGTSEQ